MANLFDNLLPSVDEEEEKKVNLFDNILPSQPQNSLVAPSLNGSSLPASGGAAGVQSQNLFDNILPTASNQIEPPNPFATDAAALFTGASNVQQSFMKTPETIIRAGRGVNSLLPDNFRAGAADAMGAVINNMPLGGAIDLAFQGVNKGSELLSRGADVFKQGDQYLAENYQPFKQLGVNAQTRQQALDVALDTGDLSQLGDVLTSPHQWAETMAQAIPSLVIAEIMTK